MRFSAYIQEEWVSSGKGNDSWDVDVNFPIYKNPDASDFKELRKADREEYRKHKIDGKVDNLVLRSIIDLKNENVFVWNATLGVHIDGFNALKKSGEIKLEPDSAYNLFCGSPTLENNKNKLSGGDEALSFIEYIRFYGIGTTKPYKGNLEDVTKKTNWLKKYYSCKISVGMRNGSPEIDFY